MVSRVPGCQNDRILMPEMIKKVSCQLVAAYGGYGLKHEFCPRQTPGSLGDRHKLALTWDLFYPPATMPGKNWLKNWGWIPMLRGVLGLKPDFLGIF